MPKLDLKAIEGKHSHDRFSLLNISPDGTGVFKNHYTRCLKLGGIDYELRTQDEQIAILQEAALLHNSFEDAEVMYLYVGETLPMQPIIDQYEAQFWLEKNTEIQRVNVLDREFLRRMPPAYKRSFYQINRRNKTSKRRGRGRLDLSMLRGARNIIKRELVDLVNVITRRAPARQQLESMQDKRDRAVPRKIKDILDDDVRRSIRTWHQLGSGAVELTQAEYAALYAHLCQGQLVSPNVRPASQVYGSYVETPDSLCFSRPPATTDKGQPTSEYSTVIVANNCPLEVQSNFLAPLLKLVGPRRITVAVHITPLYNKKVLITIAKERRRLKAKIVALGQKGKPPEMGDLERLDDLDLLADTIERQGHNHVVTILVAVTEDDPEKLEASRELVMSYMADMGLDPCLQTADLARAYDAVLPSATNTLLNGKMLTGNFEQNVTDEGTGCFLVNGIPELYHDDSKAVIYGLTDKYRSLVRINAWLLSTAPHKWRSGKTGYGKTLGEVTTDARELAVNPEVEIIAVDPNGGMEPLCQQVDGALIDWHGTVINCMDVMQERDEQESYLAGLFGMMTGRPLTQGEKQANAQALKELYHHFGYYPDGSQQVVYESARRLVRRALENQRSYFTARQQPHFSRDLDLAAVLVRAEALYNQLDQDCRVRDWIAYYQQFADPRLLPKPVYQACEAQFKADPELAELLASLSRSEQQIVYRTLLLEYRIGTPTLFDQVTALYAHGGEGAQLAYYLGNFVDPELDGPTYDGQTNVDIKGSRLIVFSVRDVPEDKLPVVMYTILGWTWNRIVSVLRPRKIVLDEFSSIIQANEDAARFAAYVAKRGRAFQAALTIITQDAQALFNSVYGLEILSCCALKEIGYQDDPVAIEQIGYLCGLTVGEMGRIPQLLLGESLLCVGRVRTVIHYELSQEEIKLWDTKVTGKEQKQAWRRQAAQTAEQVATRVASVPDAASTPLTVS